MLLFLAPTLLLLPSLASSYAYSFYTDGPRTRDTIPVDYTVAFVGDTGVRTAAAALLKDLKTEHKVDAYVHAGDLGYSTDENAWWNLYDSVGSKQNITYIGTSGNHDLAREAAQFGVGYNKTFFHEYAKNIRKREAGSGAECRGVPGEMEACHFTGIVVVNLGYGLPFDERTPEDYARFVTSAFDAHPGATWRICHFHIPIAPYAMDSRLAGQTVKDWSVLEACQAKGAAVANAHHHSYSRTHSIISYRKGTFEKGPIALRPNRSVQWVSGLGGHCPSPVDHKLSRNPVFAARATHLNQRGKAPADLTFTDFGALICKFNPRRIGPKLTEGLSRPNEAVCKFRDLTGMIYDEFTMTSAPIGSLNVSSVAAAAEKGSRHLDAVEKEWEVRKVDMANGKYIKSSLDSQSSSGQPSSASKIHDIQFFAFVAFLISLGISFI